MCMDSTYTLSEHERAAIISIKEQTIAAQKLIDEKQKELAQLHGAFNGMAMLIARQQGLFTGSESISMPDDLSSITVTIPDPITN
jgi:hypothetical protein